jgi:2-phosphosulfolactate phosphatase
MQMKNIIVDCEWGLKGIEQFRPFADVIIIVDILSFSTCVDIAVSNGAVIYPYAYKDSSATAYAEEMNAKLASFDRGKPGEYSLSPATLMNIPFRTKLVLPSPNGSELTMAVNEKAVLCGSLRNCRAAANYAVEIGSSIAVIPAGEKWPDGTLRPAIEDFIGAGAIISYINGSISAEAEAAQNMFKNYENTLSTILKNCMSGTELIERGFEMDVELAAEVNVSSTVPVLKDRAYINMDSFIR